MENGAFAPREQMLPFPHFFQIHGISKASKGVNMESGQAVAYCFKHCSFHYLMLEANIYAVYFLSSLMQAKF